VIFNATTDSVTSLIDTVFNSDTTAAVRGSLGG